MFRRPILVLFLLALAAGCKPPFGSDSDDSTVKLKAQAPVLVADEAPGPENHWVLDTQPQAAEVPRQSTITYTTTWERVAEGYRLSNYVTVRWMDAAGEPQIKDGPVRETLVTDPATAISILCRLPQVIEGTGNVSYVADSLKINGVATTPEIDEGTGFWLAPLGNLTGSASGVVTYSVLAE